MIVLALLLCAAAARAQCGLLSWDAYRARPHSLPYVLRVAASAGGLLMFGARHTRDPRDAQLVELERLWAEFRPSVAFSEGGIWPASASRDVAVTRYGEPGLLRFLADRDGVPIRNLEPPEGEEAAALGRQFPPERLKLFYYLRFLIGQDSQEDARRSALLSVQRRQRLTGPPDSVAELEALARALLPRFESGDPVEDSWFIPTRDDTFLNAIARAASDYRNCHMAPLVVQSVREGRRVFVVVGGSHVIIQEPAIRAALLVP